MESVWLKSSTVDEKYFERSKDINNSLFDLHKNDLPPDFQTHLSRIAEIIARCNAEHHIQPHLAHSHFWLEPGEIMLGQAIQVAPDSDPPMPTAFRTAPTQFRNIDQGNIYPHILGWDVDEKGVLHPFPYQYRIGHRSPPADLNPEAIQPITDYVAAHSLQHRITLEIVLEPPEQPPEQMVEFMFSSCVLSTNAIGVPHAFDPGFQRETSWRVENKNGSVCITSVEKYVNVRGAHVEYPDEKGAHPAQLFRTLRQEGVWDNELWTNSHRRNGST